MRLRDSFSATAPRTPLSGIRSPAVAATGAAAATAATGSGARSAASTSARMIRPSGPDPRRARRSTPLSLASLRTSGEITGTGPAGAAGAAATGTGAGAGAGAATGAATGADTAAVTGRTRRRRAGREWSVP